MRMPISCRVLGKTIRTKQSDGGIVFTRGVGEIHMLRSFSYRQPWKMDMYHSSAELGALYEKVQVGKDQEKAQSEKDSHSKNRGGKKPN